MRKENELNDEIERRKRKRRERDKESIYSIESSFMLMDEVRSSKSILSIHNDTIAWQLAS